MSAEEELRALLRSAEALRSSNNSSIRESSHGSTMLQSISLSAESSGSSAPNSSRKYQERGFSFKDNHVKENSSQVL
jgi:hypothetical protein